MKSLLIIFTLALVLISCSSVTPGRAILYEASSIKPECKQLHSGHDFDFSSIKKKDVKKWEQFSGYKKCEYTKITPDTIITQCKQPMPFKKITTSNMAKCHSFVKKNLK